MQKNVEFIKPSDAVLSKVSDVTLAFWVIKIAATTLGETGGDALSMGMGLGYAVSTLIFSVFFLGAVFTQISAAAYRPWLYWTVIIATTTVGTTIADYVDRSLGIGYIGGSLILFTMLAAVIILWRLSCGTVSVRKIHSRKVEFFYWMTILCSNTLGTALGDFVADDSGLGYEGSALIFSGILALIAATYYFTRLPRSALFWLAFVFTRPLGAVLGDLLTKPYAHGGFAMSQIGSTAALAVFMAACIMVTSKKMG